MKPHFTETRCLRMQGARKMVCDSPSRLTARVYRVFVLTFAVACVLSPHARAADDPLARAKDLYASAAYDEALTALDQLGVSTPAPAEARTIAEYRIFCLLALGRQEEARKQIEQVLERNPQYVPSADAVSPRIQATIREVRKEILPNIVRDRYALAKAAFTRKDPDAARQFEQVLTLLNDSDLQGSAIVADMRTVVTAFRDLAVAANAAGPAPIAPLSPPIPADPPPPMAPIYSAADRDVIPPIPQSQSMPRWTPRSIDADQQFSGVIEIVIDQRGSVVSAAIRVGVHPAYNPLLLEAAQTWKFLPARMHGVPVQYRKMVEIRLKPST